MAFKLIDKGGNSQFLRYERLLNLLDLCGIQNAFFPAKCNSGHIAIQCFYIKQNFIYQYAKIQLYASGVKKICVFARYTTIYSLRAEA